MKLHIMWEKPVLLRSGLKDGLIYNVDYDSFDRVPGVYIFARKYGKSYEALYVGQSKNIRSRIKSHLNNLKLMRHIEEAKSGKRFVIVGYASPRPGQKVEKVIKLLERGLIRHFLSEGHDLVNQQGVRIRRHSIESAGGVPKAFIPSTMFLEMKRGD